MKATRLFALLNGITDANLPASESMPEWVFHPGMLFSGMQKWWTNNGLRHSPHEGLDITFYRRPDGMLRHLSPGCRIPAMDNGEVVNLCTDFLGKSIVVLDTALQRKNTQVVCVYAHVTPDTRIKKGLRLKKGELIAALPSAAGGKSAVLPHLHLTVAEVPKRLPFHLMNWQLFGGSREDISLINPVHV